MLDDTFIKCDHIGTNLMIADMLTKPMGGAKFREFRRIIMTYDMEETLGEVSDEDDDK